MASKKSSTKKRKARQKRSKLKYFLVYLLVFTTLFTVTFIASYSYVLKKESLADEELEVSIAPTTGVEITIPRGSSTSDIANILRENGIIEWPSIFKLQSKINGYDGTFMSGNILLVKN